MPFHTVMLENRDYYLVKDGIVAAGNTIYPGHLVVLGATGVILNASLQDVDAMVMFALENDLIGRDIDTPYTAGETIYYAIPNRGARWAAFLVDEGNVAFGAALSSDGLGGLIATSTGKIVAYADQAVNNTAGGTGPDASTRIRVRAA